MRNTRIASLLLLFAVLAPACRHVPPDPEERVAWRPPEVERRTPQAAEVAGAWLSVENRGLLSDLGAWVIYVFEPGGAYTGALVSATECTPIGGTWACESGVLDLDDGFLVFTASMVGDRLELVYPDGFLALRPLGAGEAKAPELAAGPVGP